MGRSRVNPFPVLLRQRPTLSLLCFFLLFSQTVCAAGLMDIYRQAELFDH